MLNRFAFALALVAAGPAHALTCPRPSVSNSYEIADERSESFVIALGSLERAGSDMPDAPASENPNRPVGYMFPARFEGRFAGSDGFFTDQSVDVMVDVTCEASWCGGESLSDYGLYFLRVDEEKGYVLESGPCAFFFFDNPTEHLLMEVIGEMN